MEKWASGEGREKSRETPQTKKVFFIKIFLKI
jgi:hypothetical protein